MNLSRRELGETLAGAVAGSVAAGGFGARPDDDTDFVQACIDQGVPIPHGTYRVRRQLRFDKALRFNGATLVFTGCVR